MGSNLKQAIADEVASTQAHFARSGVPIEVVLEKHGQVAVLAHGHVLGRAYARRGNGAVLWFTATSEGTGDDARSLHSAVAAINGAASRYHGVRREPESIVAPLPPAAPPPAPADRWVPAGSGSTLAHHGRVVARVYKQGKYYHARLYPGDERYGPYDTMAEAKTAAEWRVALES